MSNYSATETVLSPFYIPLKSEVKHFASMIGILDKLELDKNLEQMGFSFTKIIQSEISYAADGRLIRTQKNPGIDSNDRSAGAIAREHPNFQRESQDNIGQYELVY